MAGRTRKKSEILEPIFKEFPTRLDEHVRECGYVRIPKIVGFCSICEKPLTKKFPYGFPKEWRWCCFCKIIGEWVIRGEKIETTSSSFKKQTDKVAKLVNLVG